MAEVENADEELGTLNKSSLYPQFSQGIYNNFLYSYSFFFFF